MQSLSPRQQSILNRIIESHIDTAQPVASRFITELYHDLYRNSYSPATVRHEMGLLEQMGYLTHPHTSAGRLPTDLGYRYYVDHSLQWERLPNDFSQQVARDLQDAEETDVFTERALSILSNFSKEVSVVVILDSRNRPRLFLQGSTHLLEKPEFQDLKKIRDLFRVFEEKKSLAEWITQRPSQPDVAVTIGRENGQEALQDCSLVSADFFANGKKMGTLALIGARRMKYARTFPLVSHMSRILAGIIERMEND